MEMYITHYISLLNIVYLIDAFSLSWADSSGGEYKIKAPGSSGSCKACRTPSRLIPSDLLRVGPV